MGMEDEDEKQIQVPIYGREYRLSKPLKEILLNVLEFNITGSVVYIDTITKRHGGHCDVFQGRLSNGALVAIKRLRIHLQDDPKFTKVSNSIYVVDMRLTASQTLETGKRNQDMGHAEAPKHNASHGLHFRKQFTPITGDRMDVEWHRGRLCKEKFKGRHLILGKCSNIYLSKNNFINSACA